MKVTVKEGLHVPALAVAPNKKRRNGVRRYISWRGFFVPALAVAPNKNGGTASAGTKSGVLRLHKLLQTN